MTKDGICLQFTVKSNGLQGGDAGHGGRTDIIISSISGAYMENNGKQTEKIKLSFCGDWELYDCAKAFTEIGAYPQKKIDANI